MALNSSERRELIWLFAIAFMILAAGFGLRDPWPADEPRFVLVAKQMITSGDWLFPHRGHELYPDKPPLYFWLLAISYQVIGSWRWSFLLPSLLSGLGTLWLSYDIVRRLWSHRAGLWSVVAVLAAVQFANQFKRAQIDPTLVLFTTLSLYGLCRHLLLGPHWRWFWFACFVAGAGVVLKGVGFLPLIALIPFVLMQRRNWAGLADLDTGNFFRWSAGALLFFAAISLWLLPLLIVSNTSGNAEHQAYLHNLLLKQTATRYAEAWHHRQPWWYFIAIIALFWQPFSLTFIWLWRDWQRAWQSRDARVWLPLSWAVMVIVFFSLSPGKRDMYILPALPAFAWAAAPFMSTLASRKDFRRALLALLIVLSTLVLALGLVALLGHPDYARSLQSDRGLGSEIRWLWWLLASVGFLGFFSAITWRTAGVFKAMALFLVSLWCGYGLVAYPVLNASSSASGLMQRARALAGPQTTIGLVGWKEQNLLQARGPTEEFGYRQPIAMQLQLATQWLSADPKNRRILLSQSPEQTCLSNEGHSAIRVGNANRRHWYLLAKPANDLHCLTTAATTAPAEEP